MSERGTSKIVVEMIGAGLGICLLVALMVLPFYELKEEVDRQRAVKYHIIDISGHDYYCDDYTNNNNVIEFTDYEGRFIKIYKVKTIIKNK